MWASNDFFLNRNTDCGTCACIVLVDRINTEATISGLTGKDIGSITGDLINCIQKIRYFLPERDRKVAGTIFIGCNVILMKRTNLSSPQSELHLEQHRIWSKKGRPFAITDCS